MVTESERKTRSSATTRRRRGSVVLLALAILPACRNYDDGRVQQALNQRGFGRKYVGDANELLTIGVGDSFSITDQANPDVVGVFTVAQDGVVDLPLVGEVFVAGFTKQEIAQAINQQLSEYFNDPRVVVSFESITSKRFYLRGESLREGRLPLREDTTVWDAVMFSGVPVTADIGDIEVIRADPYHPLIIPVDLAKMLDHGDSSDNILIREDDIIVIRPNIFGMVRNFVRLLITPITPVSQLLISVRNIDTIWQSFEDDENFFVGNRGVGYNQGTGNVNTVNSLSETQKPGVIPPAGDG